MASYTLRITSKEERFRIFELADSLGLKVYYKTRTLRGIKEFPNLHFDDREITITADTPEEALKKAKESPKTRRGKHFEVLRTKI